MNSFSPCQAAKPNNFTPQGGKNKKATTPLRQSLLYRVIRLGYEPSEIQILKSIS